MSWRLIFAILVLAAGASAWGGLRLGDWLIAHGPSQIEVVTPQYPAPTQNPVLDADGKPFVATAPQPLSDGRLGVPSIQPPVAWHIQADSLLAAGRPIALATTTISMDEAIRLASQNQFGAAPQGVLNAGAAGALIPIEPTDATPTGSAAPPPAALNDKRWQAAFQSELKACASLGFFSRPSCAWAARKKYCEPHQAWGRVKDCPAKQSAF